MVTEQIIWYVLNLDAWVWYAVSQGQKIRQQMSLFNTTKSMLEQYDKAFNWSTKGSVAGWIQNGSKCCLIGIWVSSHSWKPFFFFFYILTDTDYSANSVRFSHKEVDCAVLRLHISLAGFSILTTFNTHEDCTIFNLQLTGLSQCVKSVLAQHTT